MPGERFHEIFLTFGNAGASVLYGRFGTVMLAIFAGENFREKLHFHRKMLGKSLFLNQNLWLIVDVCVHFNDDSNFKTELNSKSELSNKNLKKIATNYNF